MSKDCHHSHGCSCSIPSTNWTSEDRCSIRTRDSSTNWSSIWTPRSTTVRTSNDCHNYHPNQSSPEEIQKIGASFEFPASLHPSYLRKMESSTLRLHSNKVFWSNAINWCINETDRVGNQLAFYRLLPVIEQFEMKFWVGCIRLIRVGIQSNTKLAVTASIKDIFE